MSSCIISCAHLYFIGSDKIQSREKNNEIQSGEIKYKHEKKIMKLEYLHIPYSTFSNTEDSSQSQ